MGVWTSPSKADEKMKLPKVGQQGGHLDRNKEGVLTFCMHDQWGWKGVGLGSLL